MEGEKISGLWHIVNFIDEWKIFILIITIFLLYLNQTSTFDHFAKRGIVFIKPKLFVGNTKNKILGKQSLSELQLEIYNTFKGNRYAGIFEARLPLIYILDPDLIKAVTIRDFDHFMDRNSNVVRVFVPRFIERMLVRLTGSEWKDVRSKLTPTFSSARLKHMLPLVEACSDQLIDFLHKCDGKELEMKETMGRYTLEVIGVTAFGITSDALSDEKSKFVELAGQLITLPPITNKILIYIALFFYPELGRLYNMPTLSLKIAKKLVEMVLQSKVQRKKTGQRKNDFLQLLIDASEKEEAEAEKGKKIQIDDDTISAQSFVFLAAGYETSSTLLAFATHFLATKPDIQKKLRDHILEMTKGKEMSYELLSELTYLEGFLLETLRFYPPVARVERVCTKNYIIPGSNVEIKKGETVAIPVNGVHMDPDIYKDPEEFRPERFIGDAKREVPPHLYLAFGSGPRNCIGARFAMVSVKLAIVRLLENFEVKTCDKTEDPLQTHKLSVFLKAANGIWVKLNKINKEKV